MQKIPTNSRPSPRKAELPLDLTGPHVQRGSMSVVAAFTGLAGRDPVGGVQHRHALDHIDGQVEVRHLMRVRAARGGADLGQLARAGIRVRGPVGRHRRGFAFPGCPGRARLDQELSARPDVVLVQRADHGRVDLTS